MDQFKVAEPRIGGINYVEKITEEPDFRLSQQFQCDKLWSPLKHVVFLIMLMYFYLVPRGFFALCFMEFRYLCV